MWSVVKEWRPLRGHGQSLRGLSPPLRNLRQHLRGLGNAWVSLQRGKTEDIWTDAHCTDSLSILWCFVPSNFLRGHCPKRYQNQGFWFPYVHAGSLNLGIRIKASNTSPWWQRYQKQGLWSLFSVWGQELPPGIRIKVCFIYTEFHPFISEWRSKWYYL